MASASVIPAPGKPGGKGCEIGVLQKGVEGRSHLGGGEAVFGKERGPLQCRLLLLVDDAGHADLGRHRGQVRCRVLPAKARPQCLYKGRVGGGRFENFFRRFRLRRLRRGVMNRHRNGAPGVHKRQFQILRQAAERPAARVDQQRRPQPVRKAGRLLVQRLPCPGRQKRRRFGKGVGGLGHPQRDGQNQLVLRPGQGHIEQAHLLTAHFLLVDIGQGGVGGGLVGALPRLGPEAESRADRPGGAAPAGGCRRH